MAPTFGSRISTATPFKRLRSLRGAGKLDCRRNESERPGLRRRQHLGREPVWQHRSEGVVPALATEELVDLARAGSSEPRARESSQEPRTSPACRTVFSDVDDPWEDGEGPPAESELGAYRARFGPHGSIQ